MPSCFDRGSSANSPSILLSYSEHCLAGDTMWHFLLLSQEGSCQLAFIFLFLSFLLCVGKVLDQLLKFLRKNMWRITPLFAYLKVFWSYTHITDSLVRFRILGWDRICHAEFWRLNMRVSSSSQTLLWNGPAQFPFITLCMWLFSLLESFCIFTSSLCSEISHDMPGWVLCCSLICPWHQWKVSVDLFFCSSSRHASDSWINSIWFFMLSLLFPSQISCLTFWKITTIFNILFWLLFLKYNLVLITWIQSLLLFLRRLYSLGVFAYSRNIPISFWALLFQKCSSNVWWSLQGILILKSKEYS